MDIVFRDEKAIPLDRLQEVLSYSLETGQFSWKVSRGTVKAGQRAGGPNKEGYHRVKVFGVYYFLHRLAWAFTHGAFPEFDLDHRDTDKSNNKVDNLRPATKSQNQCNRTRTANSKSRFKGVTWSADRCQWLVRCCVNGSRKHLGYFDDELLAAAAYQQAAQVMHGEFYRGT